MTFAVFTPTLEAQAAQVAYHYEELIHDIANEDTIQGAVTAAELGQAVIVSAGDDAKELESSHESMERLTVQVVGLPTEAAESLKIEFERVEFGLAPLPFAQQGGDPRGNVLYWVDPDPGALPAILVVTQDSLPDGVNWTLPEDFFIGGGGDKRELLAALHKNGLPKGTPVEIFPFEADYGTASEPGAAPSGELTMGVLLTWFKFFYGDEALTLLGFYLDGGNLIILEDVLTRDLHTSENGNPATFRPASINFAHSIVLENFTPMDGHLDVSKANVFST